MMEMLKFNTRPTLSLLVAALSVWVVYVVGLGIYRLFFHPIARFPGPKLAAVTRWYEFYYEIVKKGNFTFHIQDLHKKYGIIGGSMRDASRYSRTR